MIARSARLLLALACLALVTCRRGSSSPPPTLGAPAAAMETDTQAPITLALLTTTTPALPPEFDPALAELTRAFESGGARVLDRDHVHKVLAEHKLTLASVVQAPITQGRMLGARYLLYAQAESAASASTLALLCIDVTSGNVLWERSFGLSALTDPKTSDRWAADQSREVLAAIKTAQSRAHLPSATVLAVANRSKSGRLDFMEPSLQGLLEDLLDAQGYRVLRRRNPQLLTRETTLGVSGLVRPDAAVLAETADLVLTATFTESTSPDVPFEQTPIQLTFGLKPRAGSAQEKRFTFTLAELAKLSADLRSTLPPASATRPAASAPADDALSRRLEAARLQADLKELVYVDSLANHRRQIELAQRVLYLDPSAKEAYFCLGFSLDALTRTTWDISRPREGSSLDTTTAYLAYLRFPRTNLKHTHQAFRALMSHAGILNKDDPEKNLPLMAEFIRWQHEVDPVKPPDVYIPDYNFDGWWRRNPQRRLEFFLWVDALYDEKKHRSVLPFKIAEAYDALKKPELAAEYLYDGLVSHKFTQLQLNGLAVDIDHWFKNGHARELAAHLDPKRSAELLARMRAQEPPPAVSLRALYGAEFGDYTALYQYGYHADERRIARRPYATTQPATVDLPVPLVHSVLVQRTASGLWMQGGTEDGPLALFFSETGEKWQRIATPDAMNKVRSIEMWARSANHIISIVEIGDETIFATPADGLFVYDRLKKTWRHLTRKEGLPAAAISRMCLSADGKSAWIADGGFLVRYEAGKIFMTKIQHDLYPHGMLAVEKRLMMVSYENQVAFLDPETKSPKPLLTGDQLRRLVPVASLFGDPPRDYNAGISSWRRMAAVGDKIYLTSKFGLTALSAEGKPVAHYRPDSFYHWQDLGGWVLGNSPLPPCVLLEVIPDDKDPQVLWLLSKLNDYVPPYDFGYAAYEKKHWAMFFDMPGETQCFITAFDTRTNRFSKPIKTKAKYMHAEPFGDYIYMTGKTFSRVPKSLWNADQAVNDEGPKVEASDTLVGQAARALLLGDKEQALAHLQSAIDAGIAPAKVRQMQQSVRGLSIGKGKTADLPK